MLELSSSMKVPLEPSSRLRPVPLALSSPEGMLSASDPRVNSLSLPMPGSRSKSLELSVWEIATPLTSLEPESLSLPGDSIMVCSAAPEGRESSMSSGSRPMPLLSSSTRLSLEGSFGSLRRSGAFSLLSSRMRPSPEGWLGSSSRRGCSSLLLEPRENESPEEESSPRFSMRSSSAGMRVC